VAALGLSLLVSSQVAAHGTESRQAAACRGSELSVQSASTVGRTSNDIYMIYSVQNTGGAACSLDGAPSYVDATTGRPLIGVSETTPLGNVGSVVMQPGDLASFATDWRCCALNNFQEAPSGADHGGWQFTGQSAPVADSSGYDPANYNNSQTDPESLQVGPIQAGVITQSPLIPPGAGPQPRPAALSASH
jgi:hypothetical protein